MSRNKREKFDYTILAPRIFRENTDFTFSLTIHDAKCKFDESIMVRASISDLQDETKFQIHRDFAMNPNVTELVSIPVGNVPRGRKYGFTLKGISGTNMGHKADLKLQTEFILFQTDRAIYKPNDCVKFRVLVLDWELKPAPIEKNELQITITDSRGNLLKKWNGVNTTSGVFSDEYQLSDRANLGLWKITASFGAQEETASIEVAEYVLPKFKVEIDSPGTFMPEDEKALVVVRAKYTHGMPLKGTVAIDVYEPRSCEPLVKKTVAIDGEKSVEFDIENELKYRQSNGTVFSVFRAKAEITENLTGLSQSCETNIEVGSTYAIRTNPDNHVKFEQESTANINISVRKYSGSVPSFADPSKRNITVIREQFFDGKTQSIKSNVVHRLNDDGDVLLNLEIAENESKFKLWVNYGAQKTFLGTFLTFPKTKITNNETGENNNDLLLETKDLKKKFCINKPVDMEVTSAYPIPSYTYVIVARGKIVESKTITPIFDDSYQSVYVHRFSFVPHFGYAPKAMVIVYCSYNGSIVSSSFIVQLDGEFNNFIDLDVSQDLAKPGDVVNIKIGSNPNSYIGLLGIDESVLILRSGNDLPCNESLTKIRETDCCSYFMGGLNIFSNLKLNCGGLGKESTLHLVLRLRGGGESPTPVTVRKNFPETWIWDSIDGKDFNGLLDIKKTVPDSLTTWILTGFSIDPIKGLAVIKAPLKLCVQQPFHISLNLPYSVKRGEAVTIRCSIFNYLPDEIETEVTLDNEQNEFEFIDSATAEEMPSKVMKLQYRRKRVVIQSGCAVNSNFIIRPQKVGSIPLKITAVSSAASDCIIKQLNVECEGVPQFVNKSVFIDLREKSTFGPIDLPIEFPKIALPDSQRIEITCLGDLLGGTIKNLHQLIRMPFGCGEQNMLGFVPNIVVLNYLKNKHQLTKEIEAKAKRFMEIGYQRELGFKHPNGSFSAFGEYDKKGSTWLTAFVAKSFQQASEHIVIENDIIDQALKWLSEEQSSNGSFVEKGNVIHKEMQSGSSNGLALTAYVLTAFLVNKKSKDAFKATIEMAIENIIKSLESCNDVYALAVCAYALQLADHRSKKDAIDRLIKLAKSNGTHKWWDKKSKTINIEVTAYALLTLLENSEYNSEFIEWLLPISKWLLNQRNSIGGFHGTQDTIIGIEALANFAAKIAVKETAVKIGVTTSNNTKMNFDVNADNSLVLQSQKLPPDVKSLRIDAAGKGFSLLELAYSFNVSEPGAEPAFSLKPKAKLVSDDHMNLEIVLSYQPPMGKDLHKRSNMCILQAELPSGFVVNTELLNQLKTTETTVKLIETKNGDTVAVIYFDYLTSEAITLGIVGLRENIVDERKPAPIVVYDYYDSALIAREFYSIEAVA